MLSWSAFWARISGGVSFLTSAGSSRAARGSFNGLRTGLSMAWRSGLRLLRAFLIPRVAHNAVPKKSCHRYSSLGKAELATGKTLLPCAKGGGWQLWVEFPSKRQRTMGPQGKRWPTWKKRRDNSSQDITDENRKKKLFHGIKCLRKVSVERHASYPSLSLSFFGKKLSHPPKEFVPSPPPPPALAVVARSTAVYRCSDNPSVTRHPPLYYHAHTHRL